MVKELQRHNETGPTKNNTDHLMAMIVKSIMVQTFVHFL